MIYGLDLFSGIGGISLGLKSYVRTIAYCEQDRYAQGVLLSRMSDGQLDRAPIWDDVRTLHKEQFETLPEIIFGGFPCQDISCAGLGVGLEGKRSGLFFEIIRLVCEIRPRFVFLENVPAITVRGLDRVLLEFTTLGYDCRWTIVSAAELGAPHLRERWFLLAYYNSLRELQQKRRKQELRDRPSHLCENASNTNCEGLERLGESKKAWETLGQFASSDFREKPEWFPEPTLCRGDDGLRFRVERLKCLGNACIPLQAKTAFERLMGV